MIPFDSVAFFANLAQYNEAIWPAQAVAFALGLVALVLLFARTPWSSMLIAALLAASWIWMGVVYHLQHFATINFLAPILGLAFILQGVLFVWTGVIRRRVSFGFAPGGAAWTGLALALFAMAGYPALAWGLGHAWPELPAFGVAPCPTGIFTFAMLLTTLGRSPVHLAIIPLLWALVSGTAAYFLDMPLDIVMPVIGLGALALIVWKSRAQS